MGLEAEAGNKVQLLQGQLVGNHLLRVGSHLLQVGNHLDHLQVGTHHLDIEIVDSLVVEAWLVDLKIEKNYVN